MNPELIGIAIAIYTQMFSGLASAPEDTGFPTSEGYNELADEAIKAAAVFMGAVKRAAEKKEGKPTGEEGKA